MRAIVFLFVSTLLVVAAVADEGLSDEQRRLNVASFDQVWTTIRDGHFDPELGGLDWDAVRRELRPRVEQAGTMHDARGTIQEMTDRLGLSHFGLIPAEAYEMLRDGEGDLSGVTGIDVRVVNLAALVVSVEPESPAARAGVRPGWRILKIDGRVLDEYLPEIAAEFEGSSWKNGTLAGVVLSRLRGGVGESVALTFLDGGGQRTAVEIIRAAEPGTPRQFGYLPPIHVRADKQRLEPNVGYIRFNMFLDPLTVMPVFNGAMTEFMDADGIVIDVRGNPGGLPGMVLGMIGWLTREDTATLGTFMVRDDRLKLVVNARVQTYDGPVAVLADELSGSASELFAGGLQDMGRAQVFGVTTAGAVLPSMVEQLPNGDGFQYAFGHYETINGEVLEGRGVTPDVTVSPTREALLRGGDPILDAAIEWIESMNGKEQRNELSN